MPFIFDYCFTDTHLSRGMSVHACYLRVFWVEGLASGRRAGTAPCPCIKSLNEARPISRSVSFPIIYQKAGPRERPEKRRDRRNICPAGGINRQGGGSRRHLSIRGVFRESWQEVFLTQEPRTGETPGAFADFPAKAVFWIDRPEKNR